MHICSVCKVKCVKVSLHGVKLNKVIIQRGVIFSLKHVKDAHDYRPALNILNVTDSFFRVLHCDMQAGEMDDGRWPRNQALTFQREISWDTHPYHLLSSDGSAVIKKRAN